MKVSGHESIPVTGWEGDEPSGDVDAQEWWFRVPLPPVEPEDGEEVVLCFDGLATVCDVFVDGEPVLESRSMFLRHEAPFRGGRELAIRCRPLEPPSKPRARWRSPIADNGLRWFRTTLIGRTWYTLHVRPAWYFDGWTHDIFSAVHLRVMRNIKTLAEAERDL